MELNYFSTNRLRTGNNKIDEQIGYLLGIIQGDIDLFLNQKGDIVCSKINRNLNSILLGLDKETQILVQQTLIKVRGRLQNILNLSIELEKCKNFYECMSILDEYGNGLTLNIISLNIVLNKCFSLSECEIVISKYGTGLTLDIFSLSTILNKCSSFTECENAISKYGNGLTLNIISLSTILNKCSSFTECENVISKYGTGLTLNNVALNTIFKIILNDKSLDKYTAKDLIKNTLEGIDNIGNLNKEDESVLINQINSSDGTYNDFIFEVINGLRLSRLYFLNVYLKPEKKEEKKHTIGYDKNQRIEISNTDERLEEAFKAGLNGSLAYDFAYGRLQIALGGGQSNKSNKKGSRFGRRVKEM